MIIFPAIDIKDGQCVRLYQGDYAQITTYDIDPAKVAQRWQSCGASWLHIIDLDGAATGHPVHVEAIKKIRASTSLHIELGGGLRTLGDISQMLDLGIDRAILGTVVLTDRSLLMEAVTRWKEQIAVSLDARHGSVAISGWRETSQVRATLLASELCSDGVQRFIYTDIARDGALKGPNIQELKEIQRAISCSLIASGGVSSMDDLRALAALDIEGTIVGKSLYTGNIDLAIAIEEFER